MVSRICAIWLVVLIVLPFTAPFPAVDTGASSLAPTEGAAFGWPSLDIG
jgi:hypothetical protein